MRARGIRGFERPRMWAQYADRFAGICLCFDRETLVRQTRLHFGDAAYLDARGVRYALFNADRPSIRITDHPDFRALDEKSARQRILNHVWEMRDFVYFEKLGDWSGEAEFRIAVVGDSEGPEFVDIGDSLAGVLVGELASQSVVDATIDHGNKRGIGVYLQSWDTGRPRDVPMLESSLDKQADPFSGFLYY